MIIILRKSQTPESYEQLCENAVSRKCFTVLCNTYSNCYEIIPRKPMYTEHITIHQQFLTVHYWPLLGKDQLTRDQRVGIKFVANFAS